jgi:uncharacterized protein (TIGR02271 family)
MADYTADIRKFSSELLGKPVYGSDDQKIGEIETFYYDFETGEPEWVGVKTGFLGTKRVLVPVEGARQQNGGDLSLRVPFPKDRVKDSPDIDQDEISMDTERELYRHYGIEPSEKHSPSLLSEGRSSQMKPEQMARETGQGEYRERSGMSDTSRGSESSMTRHEEQMQVGKRDTERGRVHLRKWVETEPVDQEVELRRQTARIEREPIDRPASGGDIREQDVEMTLHEERPVVGKETIARERVTIHPEEETRKETIRGEVRKEHVEVERDAEEGEDSDIENIESEEDKRDRRS